MSTAQAHDRFGYTAAGELQSKAEGGEVTTYQYDALGNLRLVIGSSSTWWTAGAGEWRRSSTASWSGAVAARGLLPSS